MSEKKGPPRGHETICPDLIMYGDDCLACREYDAYMKAERARISEEREQLLLRRQKCLFGEDA